MNWAPVVYGRTAAADTWWQAIPEGVDHSGWLSDVVRAVFAGGSELDVGPRFLLAQNPVYRIVGIACRARDLSEQMCSDGQRELSCFVGWMAARPAGADPGAAVGPALADLQKGYAHWAAPVYDEVMSPVWNLPHSPFRRPAATHPVAVPWDETAWPASAGHGPRPGEGVWPPATWTRVWAAILVTPDPFICVVGWQHAGPWPRQGVTYLGAADAPSRPAPSTPPWWPERTEDQEPDLAPDPVDELGQAEDPQPEARREPRRGVPAWFPVRLLPGSVYRRIRARLPRGGQRLLARARLPARLRSASRRAMLGAVTALAVAAILIVTAVTLVT